MPACPSIDLLEDLALGRSSEDHLRRHVRTCTSCQATLKEVCRNNELLSELLEADLPRPGAATASRPADAIEGYELLSELSRGGQGVVYQAIQKSTKRVVALKVLLAGALATARQRQRFEREVDLVAGLKNPQHRHHT